jgi:hypothetical protein
MQTEDSKILEYCIAFEDWKTRHLSQTGSELYSSECHQVSLGNIPSLQFDINSVLGLANIKLPDRWSQNDPI